ncbi:MAG TPA: hypothetical protein VFY04_00850 [Solirubrobacterales bacterium]|nr:hypothetical protein [Solirubrobacterales bacterium]
MLTDPATERALRGAVKVLAESGPALLRDVLRASTVFTEAFEAATPEN